MQLCNVGSRVNHTKQRGTRHATMLEGKANLTTTSRCINTNISYLEHLFEQCIIIIIIIMIDPPSYLFVHAECTQCQLSSYTCNVIFAAKYYIFGSALARTLPSVFLGLIEYKICPMHLHFCSFLQETLILLIIIISQMLTIEPPT